MLADITPGIKLRGKPRALVQNNPVYNRNEERICNDSRVEQRMKRLQGPRKTIEQRSASNGIRDGVQRRDGEIEGDAPVCENGEVTKRPLHVPTSAEVVVRTLPADDEESRDESVKADERASSEEKPGIQEPARREAARWIPEVAAEAEEVLWSHRGRVVIQVEMKEGYVGCQDLRALFLLLGDPGAAAFFLGELAIEPYLVFPTAWLRLEDVLPDWAVLPGKAMTSNCMD